MSDAQDRPRPLLVWARDLAEPVEARLAGGTAVALTAAAPGKAVNEDALALLPVGERAAVLVVADGLGGHAGGGLASEVLVRCLAESVERIGGEEESIRPAVLDGIEAAHERIRKSGTGAGTTLAAVVVDPGGVRPVHAGDSGILAIGQRGAVRLQTLFHSPTGYAVEAGMLDEREALVHDERHLVSNYVGCEGMHVQLGERQALRPLDTVLLGSDGLFDNFTTEELVERIRTGPLVDAARALVTEARRRMSGESSAPLGKADDLTLVLYRRSTRE